MACSFNPSQLDIWIDLAGSSTSSGGGSSSSSCPVNPDFLGEQNFILSLPWGDIAVMAEAAFTGSAVEVTFQGPGLVHTQTFSPRFRREYGDYTLEEFGTFKVTFNGPDAQTVEVEFNLSFDPTCRKPDTDSFCGNCFSESLYNVIELSDLDSFPLPDPFECAGKPIDIDVVCGNSGDDPEGNDTIPGGVTMYYSPYTDTIPVINNIAYDTTNIPPPPPGKANVIKITTSETRNGVRGWVCKNLMFATVRDDWRTDPVVGSGSIGSDFTSPEQNINFNWPFNDLYFSKGCPGGDSVNLVPC